MPRSVVDRTLTRRDLLEWLGAGAVVALADLVPGLARASDGFAFRPGPADGPVFSQWWERTVDRQDPAALAAGWRLEVDGLVAGPRVLTFRDVLALPRTDQTTDLHCVEGWSVHDIPWNGVRLADLLDLVGPLPGARYVQFSTVRGRYNGSVPLEVAREPRTLLAYGVGGATLPLAHGFPLRVVVPRLLGYKNAKYVYRITLSAEPLDGFWVRNGYDYAAEVPAARLRPGRY